MQLWSSIPVEELFTLLNQWNGNVKDCFGRTVLHECVYQGHLRQWCPFFPFLLFESMNKTYRAKHLCTSRSESAMSLLCQGCWRLVLTFFSRTTVVTPHFMWRFVSAMTASWNCCASDCARQASRQRGFTFAKTAWACHPWICFSCILRHLSSSARRAMWLPSNLYTTITYFHVIQ
ncbi:putative ankyrin repeat protein [Trypanosoma cruzi]|uniref:Putative ankyrin repeat protein n=1 Tax=Trypanosoma cruzi TaxID=5693 RepID=A0A2V2XML7_TRYCR|nr:putative ankyrin repeat protein [Trypanosoma cruzi]